MKGSPVVLVDGRIVDSWSEDWRHECEARHIANLPTLQQRREYLEVIERKRGGAECKRLKDTIRIIWQQCHAPQRKVG